MEQPKKAISLFKHLPLLLISCALILFIYTYSNKQISTIELAVNEQSKILMEPMWTYNTRFIDEFLATTITRDDYQIIRVYDADGTLYDEALSPPPKGITQFFCKLHLIPRHSFSAKIEKNDQLLGTLEIIWRNTTVYIATYAFLLATLFYIISILYSRITTANQTLKSKVDDLHLAVDEIQKQKEYIENIFNVAPQGMITINSSREIVEYNTAFHKIIDTWSAKLQQPSNKLHTVFLQYLMDQLQDAAEGEFVINIAGTSITLEYSSSEIPEFDSIDLVVSLRDVTEIASMRNRLSQAEKLESVGQLASGIAHEINTPTQYVSSNISFLNEAFEDVLECFKEISETMDKADEKSIDSIRKEINRIYEDADWEFLAEEIPSSLEQSTDGLQRIQSIVSAMKRFSHPSGENKEHSDINSAIETTITVTRNEWKYIAEIAFNLDPSLPHIPCYVDQLNQVILILIVNAVHAIEDKLIDQPDEKGKITIRTRSGDDYAEISVSDTGAGIPEETLLKIFDPFFTTKTVGKGSGQGLAIANDIIVNKHSGKIDVQSEVGKGTTFIIHLPLKD